jgi:hypothetical protein
MKVKYLLLGKILWYKDLIVGVKGITLDTKYNECDSYRIGENPFDYELTPNTPEMKEELEKALAEQEAE